MVKSIIKELKSLRRKSGDDVYDPDLRAIAARIGADHATALQLWDSGDVVARKLAVHVAEPDKFTRSLAEKWVRDIDEWGLCDGFVARLVRPQDFAVEKAHAWAVREHLYQRRAGFALIAQMAWQKNDYPDKVFTDFLPLVKICADDDRLHVKKAVNWALRDIGKRNPLLAKKALIMAKQLQKSDNKTVRWVGTHRIKEIKDEHAGD